MKNLKKKKNIEVLIINEKLKEEDVDVSLPSRENNYFDSKIHPITQTINEIVSILGALGLTYEEGPILRMIFIILQLLIFQRTIQQDKCMIHSI